MRVLNAMEVGMVSGGAGEENMCVNPTYASTIKDFGTQVTVEIGNFFAGLNQLGSQLGAWLYNYFNC
ncbi:MAG TPA: hypothetical protein VMH83_01125 [Candidatus Acidoferrum sp.]|nr:hypothetical protein [Candidatus Acidoferrum sp.]